ncbi:MAG: RDD family protein [Thermomonas sp.]|nr:RDD family protein [Thermomonas sp.]
MLMSDLEHPTPLIGWRLLALLYDFFPLLALWFVTAAGFTLLHGDAVRGGWLGALEFFTLWLITGFYAVISWQRGGQTIGMRAWRLQLRTHNNAPLQRRLLWLRYVVGSISLLACGLGFWWAWIDRNRLTWHDRISATYLQRLPKRG